MSYYKVLITPRESIITPLAFEMLSIHDPAAHVEVFDIGDNQETYIVFLQKTCHFI